MFVRDFIYVDRPFAEVAPRFVNDRGWLWPVAARAGAEAAAVADAIRTTSGRNRARDRDVALETGPVRARQDSLVVPLRLGDDDGGRVPELDGDLEVTPIGPGRSLLALNARYRRSGRASDDAVGRIAEACVRAFLRELADTLDETSRGEPELLGPPVP